MQKYIHFFLLVMCFFCVINLSRAASDCVKGTFKGDASTYNPNFAGWKTGGQGLATGGRYDPNSYDAALQLNLAKQYKCGYGSGAICHAVVQSPDGKAMLVRVNDNGPLVPGRIIDLNEKSMRYISGGTKGKNSGIVKNVTVTLLCGVNGGQLGPLDEKERDKWKDQMFNAPPGNPSDGLSPQQMSGGNGNIGGGTGGGSSGSGGGGAQSAPAQSSPYDNKLSTGFYNPAQQPVQSDDAKKKLEALASGDSGSGDTSTKLMSCVNQKITWSCGSPATVSRGLSTPTDTVFKTRGALTGSVRVSPKRKTTYTVQCLRSQNIIDEASCAISPGPDSARTFKRSMVLSVSVDPERIKRGKRTTVTWSSVGASQCTVRGLGFDDSGTSGDGATSAFTKRGEYIYTLSCVSKNGEKQTQSARVVVE